MRKYLYYMFISLGIIFLLTWSTFAEAIIKKASWIKGDIIKYELKWCPAHKSIKESCYLWRFELDGNSALLWVKWVTWPTLIEDFTNKITAFKFQAEWRIDIKLWAEDNAENLTVNSLSYMIDKTPPQLGEMKFSENSPYISVEDRDGKKYPVKIKAALSTYFGFDGFASLDHYIDNPQDNQKEITKMKTIRFKRSDITKDDDLIITLPTLSDSWKELERSNVSGLQKIELLMNNEVLKTYTNIKEWENTFTIQPRELFKSMSENSENYVVLRAYDKASNTSEHVFNVIRDETKPLVQNNDDSFEMDFRFTWDDYNIVSQGSGLSPFTLATHKAKISYNWWEKNTHMADIIMKIEKDKDPDSKNSYILNEDEITTHNTAEIKLTDVDLGLLNPSSWKNFRAYSVEFETPGITWNKICDTVGNCISWNDILSQIRTIAGDISEETSTLQVKTPNEAFADNDSKYSFSANLKDKYWNSIREVTNTWDWVIKTNLYTFNFKNGLTQQLADNFSTSRIENPVSIQSNWINEIEDNEINSNTPKVTFKEESTSSNGIIDFDISSFIPTHGAYAFLKNDANFAFKETQWSLRYNPALTYDFDTQSAKSTSNDKLVYGNSSTIEIDADLEEQANDKYNMFIPRDYWTVTNKFWNTVANNYKELSFKDILKDNKKLQLEFASPVLYHAENFNILRDGIDSNHLKELKKDWNQSKITNIQYRDKYFDINNQNRISPIKVDFYVNWWDRNEMSWKQSFSDSPYSVKYEVSDGEDFSEWGYVSYVTYNIWSKEIMLPAISRWIKPSSWNRLQSSAYFPSNIQKDEDAGTSFLTDDLAIDGLVNNIDWGTSWVEDQSWLVSLDLERPYTRAWLLENVKKKIFEINRQDRWCTINSISVNYENTDECTFTVEWEKITFIEWNVKILWGTLNAKRSIIVRGGSIEIIWNISTKDKNGQLFLASISNDWLENITLGNNEEIRNPNKKGWISIDQKVTNIDAFILAQWPVVSTNFEKIVTNYSRDDQLLNQLHIYGSVFSLNTIGGSKTWKCPYIEQWDCVAWSDASKVYDLSFLRRYTLIDGSTVNYEGYKIPYNPDFNILWDWNVFTSWGCKYFDDTVANIDSAVGCNSNLRTPEKPNHWTAPVIIQRDQTWSMNPTYFSKED